MIDSVIAAIGIVSCGLGASVSLAIMFDTLRGGRFDIGTFCLVMAAVFMAGGVLLWRDNFNPAAPRAKPPAQIFQIGGGP